MLHDSVYARLLRFLFVALAPALVAVVATTNAVSVLHGLTPLQIWWLATLATSGALAVACLGTSWQFAGFILASLLAGSSAQLGLTMPRWSQPIHINLDLKYDLVLCALIVAQFLTAAFALIRKSGRADNAKIDFSGLVRGLGPGRLLLFFFILLAFSATGMVYVAHHDLTGFLFRQAIITAFVVTNFLSLMALWERLPAGHLATIATFIDDRISFPGSPPRSRKWDRYFPWALAFWVFFFSCLIVIVPFERMPHLGDEFSYIMNARYFALGHLSEPIPSTALVSAFDYPDYVAVGDKWFPLFPPGWSLVLMLGAFVNLEWIVNPLLGGACVLLAHGLFRREVSLGMSNLVILLMAVSPWFLAMSGSFLNHTLTLALWLASCLILSKARPDHSAVGGLISGAMMGLLFLARPLDGVVVGTLAGIWILRFFKDRKGWRTITSYCAGCIVVGALVFPYNAYLTGDPLKPPYSAFWEHRWPGSPNKHMGFGPDIGPPKPFKGVDIYKGHSVTEALLFAQHNTFSLNFELFGWCIGSLAVFIFYIFWGRWTRTDLFMLSVILALIGAYGFYWSAANFHIGPRYWFLTFVPVVAITGSGICELCRRALSAPDGRATMHRLLFILFAMSAIGMTSFLSWRGTGKYFELRHWHSDYRAIAARPELRHALIFIKNATAAEIGSAGFFNPIELDSDHPVFVKDLGPESNRKVAAAFPNREIYFARSRSADGTKAHIIAGPLSRDSLP